MGLYDTFIADCPACGQQQEVQSKLFTNSMSEYRVGDILSKLISEGCLMMKHNCFDCEFPLVASFDVKGKKFLGFTKDFPKSIIAEQSGGRSELRQLE